MMRGKIPLRLSNCFWCGSVALLILLIFVMVPFSQAEVAREKITSIRGNVLKLHLGTHRFGQIIRGFKILSSFLTS